MSNAPTKGKITAYFAPLGAEEVLDIKSNEESEGDWESDVDDDSDSDLSDEGLDFGDEVWNMGDEDFFLSKKEDDINDEILNATCTIIDRFYVAHEAIVPKPVLGVMLYSTDVLLVPRVLS